MTPYHTPHHPGVSQQTPRYGQQTPGSMPPPSVYIHQGALTPGHRTPSHRNMSTPTTIHHSR